MALKKCECALCDHARMREDICGIYCVGGFWKQPDGSCDHYMDYLEKRRSDPAPAGLTNADRIRAMSDEELAELICTADWCEVCDQVKEDGTCHAMELDGPLNKYCVAGALQWLQQPVAEVADEADS